MATRTFGGGNDSATGTGGADTFYMGAGDDRASMGGGGDRVFGQDGDDTLRGGPGSDRVAGDRGADSVYGDAGGDVLFGGEGADRMFGGDGGDTFAGNAGNDALRLGAGDNDRDVVSFAVSEATANGQDTVHEFDPRGEDRLSIGGGIVGWDDLDTNGDGRVTAGDGNSFASATGLVLNLDEAAGVFTGGDQHVTLAGVAELTRDDFLFP